jgi:xanthine/CO dehydrogenase XdhC/CoxF family maturation factor
MSLSLHRLLPLFDRERRADRAVVLATVARTSGPTYSKAGNHMLISADGQYAGLLSGGCLEGDLAERARAVLASGVAQMASYAMSGPDDLLFGLGSGCEGAMDIFLQRVDAQGHWQPMARLAQAWRQERPETLALIVRSADAAYTPGAGVFADGEVFGPSGHTPAAGARVTLRAFAQLAEAAAASQFLASAMAGVDVLAMHQPAPTRILLLGGGADAQPLVELAALLGWNVTVVDHRAHYARPSRFPAAAAVHHGGAELVEALVGHAPSFVAAVVMSHHLATDLGYLRALARTVLPYVGLLGPATRRDRLLADLGADAEALRGRLHAPIGLDIGAATPEAIALAIVAQIQGTLPRGGPIRVSSPGRAAERR